MRDLLGEVRKRILVCDGAMGTQLHAAGLPAGECPEAWAFDNQDALKKIQSGYIKSGSDIIITNTFGATRSNLDKYGQGDRVHELNKAMAESAREVAGDDIFVLGDIGPFGGFIEPLGEYTVAQVMELFSEQVKGLLEGGVDGFIVETMSAKEEMECALKAVRQQSDLPLVASMAFDPVAGGEYKTMMGVSIKDAVETMISGGADIIGANCGITIVDMVNVISEMRKITDIPLIAQPNAGKPTMVDGRVKFCESPESMASHVPDLLDAGAKIVGGCCGTGTNIIGGCCGTGPEYIKLVKEVVIKRG